MSKNKQIVIGILFAIAFVLFFISFLKIKNNSEIKTDESQISAPALTSIEKNEFFEKELTEQNNLPVSAYSEQKEQIQKTAIENDKQFIIQIEEQQILSEFIVGQSLYDAMQNLRQSGKINFEGKSFSDLGFFITSINGVSQNPRQNLYWKYFINNKEAQVGVSSYKIQDGDRIRWELTDE